MMMEHSTQNINVILLRILLTLTLFRSTMITKAETNNVTVLLNHNAILCCRHEGHVSSGQSWRFQTVGEYDEKVVYAHSKVQENFTSLIQTTENEFGLHDLVLLKTSPSLAGTYYCITDDESYELQLIILGTHPECGTEQTAETGQDLVFLNGSNEVTLSCKVHYWGRASPHMQWNILNGVEIPSNQTIWESNRTVNIIESSIRLSAMSEFLTQSSIKVTFTMFYFTLNISAEEMKEHINYSEFQFLWNSPEIFHDSLIRNTITTPGGPGENKLAMISLILVGIVFAFLVVLSMVFLLKNSKGNRSWKSRFNNDISTRRAPKKVYGNDNVSRNQLNPSVKHRTKPWLGHSRNRMPCLEAADLPIVAYAESRTNESLRNRNYDSSTIEPVNRIETEDFSIPAYAESRTNESLTSGTYNSSMNEPVIRIETEDFSIVAYAESRTNESLSSGTYNSSINEPVNKIDTLSASEKQPSVNSAMPVYAEVFKPSLRRNHLDSAPDLSDITPYAASLKAENTLSVKNQNTEVIGELDGTVYTGVSRTNKEVGDSRAPKVPKENPFYAKVDHTQQIPPPMSTT